MENFIQKLRSALPDYIRQRLYLQTIIVVLFLIVMILVSKWAGNTLYTIMAIVRFERTHTVSRLEAKSALSEFLRKRESRSKESFFRSMAITQSYNKVFSQLLVLQKTKSDTEFAHIIEETFVEADRQTAVILVNRIKTLYWHPIIKELVGYAEKANRSGEHLIALASLAMEAKTAEELKSLFSEIRKAEAEFVSYEHSFSMRCSDLAKNITGIVNFFLIAILVLSVGFTGLLTYMLARSLLQQAINQADTLEKSRQQYLNLVEKTPDLISRFDNKGVIVFVNHAANDTFGVQPKDCIGRSSFDFVHPDDREKTFSEFEAALNSNEVSFTHENRLVGIDGRIHHVTWSITAERDSNSEITGFAGIARDISAQKDAEEALRESEYLFSQMFEQATTSMSLSDPEGTIIKVNREFCKMFGVEEEIILASKYNLFRDNAAVDTTVLTALKDIFYKKKSRSWEISFNIDIASETTDTATSKTGIIFLKVFGYPVLNHKGDLEYVVLQQYDITEQKQAEEERKRLLSQLHQTQKMETIGTLAGGIAHDFNNILFPILGHAEMLMEDISEESAQRENVKEILTGAMRAKDLVNQILTFSRQDKKEFKLFKMQPVIKEALKLIRSTVPSTINIKSDISEDCGIIQADPTHIHQIVMNLATNAYHAMEETGGELTVSLNEVTVEGQDTFVRDIIPGIYACLTVADTGVGIDKYVLDKIFDPFFTTKEQGKGTGMGLAVIHGIIKNSGGSILVNSKIGQGTEFEVYLPVITNTSEENKLQDIEPVKGGTENILLVDDETSILKMEKQILTRMGYRVTTCNSSVEALETFNKSPDKFDLVISDIAMPNISGDRLASELIRIRPNIPVLLCTGFSEKIPEEKAKNIGVKGFLMKPIIREDLSRKIRDVLDS